MSWTKSETREEINKLSLAESKMRRDWVAVSWTDLRHENRNELSQVDLNQRQEKKLNKQSYVEMNWDENKN